MSDDRFDEFLQQAAQEYHRPGEAPREEMWTQIRAERQRRRHQPRRHVARWVTWGLAAAAVLVIGIGIGRYTALRSPAPVPLAVEGEEPGDAAYRVAAVDHLGRVETFLMVFRSEARVRPVERAPISARDLLVHTRLLMDSPAAQDPGLASLLEDIELVLAQIAGYSAERGGEELELIDQGIERRAVLLRLRAITPTERGVASAEGVLE